MKLILCCYSQGLANWAFYVVSMDLPKYLNDILHIPIQKNAIYSSIPRIASIFVSILTGFISDWMHTNRGDSLTNIRKIFAASCIYNCYINQLININNLIVTLLFQLQLFRQYLPFPHRMLVAMKSWLYRC